MPREERFLNTGGQQTYQRLQVQLAKIIADTAPGERLLTEPELARQLSVSRATLREAMRTFEGQGLIRRRQGVGTFVLERPQVMETGLEVLQSIETLAGKIELDVSMGDLRISKISASKEHAEALGLNPGAHLVQISRVILAEERPVAYLIDILPVDILPPAELEDAFTGSVLDFLLKRGNPLLTHSLTEIQAVAANTVVARALEIQRGDVLLLFTARLSSVQGDIVDYSSSYFLPGYFRFHVVRRLDEN